MLAQACLARLTSPVTSLDGLRCTASQALAHLPWPTSRLRRAVPAPGALAFRQRTLYSGALGSVFVARWRIDGETAPHFHAGTGCFMVLDGSFEVTSYERRAVESPEQVLRSSSVFESLYARKIEALSARELFILDGSTVMQLRCTSPGEGCDAVTLHFLSGQDGLRVYDVDQGTIVNAAAFIEPRTPVPEESVETISGIWRFRSVTDA